MRAQLTRLLAQHRTGSIRPPRGAPTAVPRRYEHRHRASRRARPAPGTLSGPATRKLCARAYHRFGDRRFERLAGISTPPLQPAALDHVSTGRGTTSTRTRPVQVAIGERRRPSRSGAPAMSGSIPSHQADLDDLKGLYHVNLVGRGHPVPVHRLGRAPPCRVRHRPRPAPEPSPSPSTDSDNGSEYVNRTVAAARSPPDEFTKSRARHTNDNALVESKNGSVVRKHLGYGHIPSRHAQRVNDFTQNVLSPYLNSTGPASSPPSTPRAAAASATATPTSSPYEKLKSLPEAAAYLTPGFQQLDAVASP